MTRCLGNDDSITTCDCCGKSNLKFTVTIELVHYGSTCATRNTGRPTKVLKSEARAYREAQIKAASIEYCAHPAYLAYMARLKERDAYAKANGVRMVGVIAMEFVRETSAADDVARVEIAARHGLRPVTGCGPMRSAKGLSRWFWLETAR